MKKHSKKFRQISNVKEDWAKLEECLGKFRSKVIKIFNKIQETYKFES